MDAIANSFYEFAAILGIAVTSYTGRTAKELEKAGADLVLLPFVDAAENIPDKLKSLKKA